MLFPFKMLSPSELGTVHEYFVCFSSQFHFKTSLKLPTYVTFQWGFTTRKVAKTKLAKVIVTFSHHLSYSRAHFLCCCCTCAVMFLSVGENVFLYECASFIWPHTVTNVHLSSLILLKKINITNRIWEEW